jgi:hypothetical protein
MPTDFDNWDKQYYFEFVNRIISLPTFAGVCAPLRLSYFLEASDFSFNIVGSII